MLQTNLTRHHPISHDKSRKSDMHNDNTKEFYAIKQALTLRRKQGRSTELNTNNISAIN